MRYEHENFAADEPRTVDGGPRGVLLHEGQGPNEYVDCNLMNREPPAGSRLVRSPATLKVTGANPTPGQKQVAGQIVDGVWSDEIVYGRWTPAGYQYRATPLVVSTFQPRG